MSNLAYANEYLKKGLSIVPVRGPVYASKEDAVRTSKIPLVAWTPFQKRLAKFTEIEEWFKRWPEANIGIITGLISGICIVDFDSQEAVQWGKDKNIFNTPLVKTARGLHAYYRYPINKTIKNSADSRLKIDLRGEGGYAVLPPSTHISGVKYEWVVGHSIDDISLASLPEIFLSNSSNGNNPQSVFLDKPQLKDLYKGSGQGDRNHMLARLCGSWVKNGLSFEECMENAIVWNSKNTPPLSDKEITQTVTSIQRYKKKEKSIEKDIFFHEYNFFKLPLVTVDKHKVGNIGHIEVKHATRDAAGATGMRVWKVFGSSQYGLGGLFDDTVFMAINKIISDIPKPIQNPIDIGSLKNITEILKIKNPNGDVFRSISIAIKRLASLTVTSSSSFYDRDKKKYIESVFHVFDKVVFKSEVSEGTPTKRSNFIWLNDSYIRSINSGYMLPVDFDEYISIKNPIAKLIYKLLHTHFHAVKTPLKIKYESLCNKLAITKENSPSQSKQQLLKAHTELLQNRIVDSISWDGFLITYSKKKGGEINAETGAEVAS